MLIKLVFCKMLDYLSEIILCLINFHHCPKKLIFFFFNSGVNKEHVDPTILWGRADSYEIDIYIHLRFIYFVFAFWVSNFATWKEEEPYCSIWAKTRRFLELDKSYSRCNLPYLSPSYCNLCHLPVPPLKHNHDKSLNFFLTAK